MTVVAAYAGPTDSVVQDDVFSRPNQLGLGSVPNGSRWDQVLGSATVTSSAAVFESRRNNISVIPTFKDATYSMYLLDATQFGAALYFRVSDSANWWRLALVDYSYNYTYQNGYTCNQNTTYVSYTNPDGTTAQTAYIRYGATTTFSSATDQSGTIDSPSGASPNLPPPYPDSYTQTTTNCSVNYATSSGEVKGVYLDKSVGGSISSTQVPLTIGSFYTVSCSGSAITVGDGTNNFTVIDGFNESKILAGIGTCATSTGPNTHPSITITEFKAVYFPPLDSVGALGG